MKIVKPLGHGDVLDLLSVRKCLSDWDRTYENELRNLRMV